MNAGNIDIKSYLPLVRKPSRYMGGEVNSVKKDLSKVALKFGLGFPDAYEVGMSHLGIQILYQILNSREDVACERFFAPWTDMEALLRRLGARLSTLESGIPLNELDIVGFSLQYELSYTNVLNILDLGGVPLFTNERKKTDPFVIGGGPSAYNPEPVADFFDAFLLGDGEEAIHEIADAIRDARARGEERADTLRRLSRIHGVYVPSFFNVTYNADSTVKEVTPLVEGYRGAAKRIIHDMESVPPPVRPIVPNAETIHDRVTVEIARGCTRGCRFCQAGMLYRPVRERKPSTIISIIKAALENTGYDEVSFLSLSAGDYTLIEPLLCGIMPSFVQDNIAVSLPSLRVGTLSQTLAQEIKKVRKTGFTLAPEAGSERLRTLINKGITEEDLIAAAKEVFTLGWRALKLYFMIGLPTETDEDVLDIVRVAQCVKKAGKQASGRAPQINVGTSSYIPKPFTPFQWEPQVGPDEFLRKQNILRKRLAGLKLGFKWNSPETSTLEGVFSRGDRRLSRVLLRAFRKGCRFDGWSEEFNYALWEEAFREESIDMGFYIYRKRQFEEVFPWDHLNAGVTKEFLYRERENALSLASTADCKVGRCSDCGVCDHKAVKNVVVKKEPVTVDSTKHGSGAAVKMRLRFSKTGISRFLSHLELINVMVRAARRAGIRVAYSQGYHPLPRISFSTPLPVGLESLEEDMTVEIDAAGGGAVEDIIRRLNGTLPEGLRLLGGALLPLKSSAPSAIIGATEYLIFLENMPAGKIPGLEDIDGLLRDFCSRETVITRIVKEDRVTEVDLKPLVRELTHLDGSMLRLVLGRNQGASIRPQDVLAELLRLSREDVSLIPILKTRAVQ